MFRFIPIVCLFIALVAGCGGGQPNIELRPALMRSADQLALQQHDYEGDIYPFFEDFCFTCHGPGDPESGIDLESATHISAIGKDNRTWERVLNMLESGQMPPDDERQPTDFDRKDVAQFIETELDTAIRAMNPDPGRVTARRLNRQEYDNSVRDLLGIVSNPSRAFPVDDSGYGFDNNGDTLTLSPLLMEKYLTAAENIVGAVLARELTPPEDGTEAPSRFLFTCGHNPEDHARGCSNAILRPLASRAYRRPVTSSEIRDLEKLVNMVQQDGDTFENGIALAVQAILVSPNFLFRIEGRDTTANVHYVNDFELASRLSYFLWSSMPDDTLFDKAREGNLRDPEILSAEVTRMIADDRADEFVANFAGQWLQLRNLDTISIDRDLYPEFNRDLRNAMRQESLLFFETVLRENQSILNFLDSDFTFLNEQLARHYGIDNVADNEHQRVTLADSRRGGVLTHASVLTLTSFPTRTSPVVRGAWILENILGTPPPPPPDDIPKIEDNPQKLLGTFRERLDQHRADPSCASCHARIDPLGFGLENYDPIGRWRSTERGAVLDSSGILPSGESFQNWTELKQILTNNPDDFIRSFTEKMLTYALGRGVETFDRPVVAGIEDTLASDDYRFHSLIREIVLSVPFQMRRSEGESKA